MKIRLTRNTVADGRSVSAGQVVEVSEATGKTLVLMGKAQEVPAAPVAVTAKPEPVAEQPTAQPEPTSVAAPIPAPPPPPPSRKAKKGQP